jgi:predicted cupin superfamily sugar epimerase
MLHLGPDGTSESFTLGPDLLAGQKVQILVPRGTWQGSFLNDGGRYALMGCTVSPGFEYSDYETGIADELIRAHPDREALIRRLCP